jgi:putative transposase
MRIFAYTIMPNHWHLILCPLKDGDLQQFMKWVTNSHTRKWHAQHKTIGSGHLYQGRYKSFLVQKDSYLLQLLRYVEQNALRAKLVNQAQDWKWSSLWRREKGTEQQKKILSELPIDIPKNYFNWVNELDDDTITKEIRYCVNKGKPFGDDEWRLDMIEQYDLGSTVRGSGRPKK